MPAIIVLHPPKGKLPNGESSPMPLASVSYGYRGEESVIQAVNDALYDGKRSDLRPVGHALLAPIAPAGYLVPMSANPELLREYARDESRRGPAPDGSHTGSAGGSVCGDLVRISLRLDGTRIAQATFDAEGCAALRACAAAACEEAEGAPALRVAALSADDLAETVGGLGPQGRHAADLVADALARALSALASSGEPIADGCPARNASSSPSRAASTPRLPP